MYKPNKANQQTENAENEQVLSDEQQRDIETFSVVESFGLRNKISDICGKLRDYIKGCGTGAWFWVVGVVLVIGLAIFGVCKLAEIAANKTTDKDNADMTNSGEVTETTTAETMSDEDFFNMLANGDYESIADEELFTYLKIDRQAVFDNKNAVGWLQIKGTDVDYVVVQAADNAYYLDKDVNGNDSESGAIYGDYRNDFNQLDRNNVIYGHNMASGAMFGTLTRMLDETFYTANDGYLYFNSQYFNNIFEVYSVYEIDLQSFCYIQTGFKDAEEFAVFVKKTQELNSVEALKDKNVPEDTYLLTLSTCVEGGTKRLVVHGYLYAREIY